MIIFVEEFVYGSFLPTGSEEGEIMSPVLHDVRAGFFLVVGFAMLAFICAVAALGTVMRPVRWSERNGHGY